MSLDLYQTEINERLSQMPAVSNPEPNAFDGFIRGTGQFAMQSFAKAGRTASLIGATPYIMADAVTGGTTLQDRYFDQHEQVFQSAVNYWTPKSGEVGSAGQIVGNLIATIPRVIANAPLEVLNVGLGSAEDMSREGVSSAKSVAVGTIQGLGFGVGVWLPVLGSNGWQRTLIGGAAANTAQGVVTRAASGAILDGTPAADQFKAFDGEALTTDALLGLAFGSLTHFSPAQRAQGKQTWEKMGQWAEAWTPTQKDALATLREAQHLNVDSTPGQPVGPIDIDTHVNRMRTSLDQMIRGEPVNVSDVLSPEFELQYDGAARFEGVAKDLSSDQAILRAVELVGEKKYTDLVFQASEQTKGQIEQPILADHIARQVIDQTNNQPYSAEPRFIQTPERLLQDQANLKTLVEVADQVRLEEGLPRSEAPQPATASLPPLGERVGGASDILARTDIPERVRTDLAEHYQKAAEVKPEFDAKIRRISEEIGTPYAPKIPAGLKGPDRAIAKVMTDYRGNAKRVKDLVRATIVIPNSGSLEGAIAGIVKEFGQPLSMRNALGEGLPPVSESGYRDVMMNVDVGGHVAEVQISTPQMMAAKKQSHPLYVKQAAIERLAKDRDLTPKEFKERHKLIAAQKKIYDAAWADSLATMARNSDSGINAPLRLMDSSGNLRSTGSQALQAPAGDNVTGTPSTSKNLVPSGNSISDTSKPNIAQTDPVLKEALRFAAENPDIRLRVGQTAEGSPIYMTPAEYLENARMDAEQARQDVNLIQAAAECLLGKV